MPKIPSAPSKPEWLEPALLTLPNIPKPMHGVNPRTVLGDSWWNKERLAAYKSTDYHCKACGVHKDQASGPKHLEGHEVYDIDYETGRMVYVRTVPVCHYCHNWIHDGRLVALLEKSMIHHTKYTAIIQHGLRVLREAGLQRYSRQDRDEQMKQAIVEGKVAEWSEWRLVVNGQEFPPLYKSLYDWQQKHKETAEL